MAPTRRRENRENQFYDVGVQGRKTGITLEDRGVRDEHGLEPISGIFSSPEKSPPGRSTARRTGGTITDSESMEIQESSVADLATSGAILRNSRTHLPPPKSRSPMKTALGSSPRRQSSMGPRAQSVNNLSSPLHAVSHPAVSRRLDFEQEELSLQETPALSGSGQRRERRANVYDIEMSPSGHQTTTHEESLEEEMALNEDTGMTNGGAEESFAAEVGNDTIAGAEAAEGSNSIDVDESEIAPKVAKQTAKRSRKRKSDALESAPEEESSAPKTRKRGVASAQASNPRRKSKNAAPPSAAQPRRSKRVSDIMEQENSTVLDASVDTSTNTPMDVSEEVMELPAAPKARGRPPKTKNQPENAAPAKEKAGKEVFKKPKPASKGTARSKIDPKESENEPQPPVGQQGKLVDAYGKSLSKKDIDEMSAASAGSRYGRGRHLSVFREMDPESVARVGRTGRHRVAPIDFWKNEKITYDHSGNMESIVKNEDPEPERKNSRTKRGPKGKKRGFAAIEEEEEVELDPWEEQDGVLVGNYRGFDPAAEVATNQLVEDSIAWSQKGIKPVDVADGSFKFTKLAASHPDGFFSWGFIELKADQMKRSKNSRRMHMVFHVQSGAVEVKVHENEFTVHRGGVWQVPRGNTYSIRNVGSSTSRVFFAQACELSVQAEE